MEFRRETLCMSFFWVFGLAVIKLSFFICLKKDCECEIGEKDGSMCWDGARFREIVSIDFLL